MLTSLEIHSAVKALELMMLSIHLSHDEKKPFTPGSMVLGVVKLTACEDQTIESLHIDFRGLTQVFLKQNYGDLVVSKTDYVSKSYLFSRHLNLYSGADIQRKGNYAWPFAFRIPLFAAPRTLPPGSKEFFGPKKSWKSDLALDVHPLPPSMQQSGKFVCNVQYVLEATLVQRPLPTNCPQSKGKKVQTQRAISVQNLGVPDHLNFGGDWPYVTYRYPTRFSFAKFSNRSIHRLLPIFSKKSTYPNYEMKINCSVLLPKKLEIKEDQALSIPFCCSMDSPPVSQGLVPSAVDRCPKLVMYSFKLSLVQHIQVRAGCHTSSSDKRIFTRKGSGVLPVSSINTSASQTGSNTPASFVNLCDTIDLSVPIDLLAADFSTYNIARFHSLEVFIRLEYEKKRERFSIRNAPLRIIPQSGRELERRLSEGVEEDDVYGCDLAGIQWRNYVGSASGREREAGTTLQAVIEGYGGDGDGDLTTETPPPAYAA